MIVTRMVMWNYEIVFIVNSNQFTLIFFVTPAMAKYSLSLSNSMLAEISSETIKLVYRAIPKTTHYKNTAEKNLDTMLFVLQMSVW